MAVSSSGLLLLDQEADGALSEPLVGVPADYQDDAQANEGSYPVPGLHCEDVVQKNLGDGNGQQTEGREAYVAPPPYDSCCKQQRGVCRQQRRDGEVLSVCEGIVSAAPELIRAEPGDLLVESRR